MQSGCALAGADEEFRMAMDFLRPAYGEVYLLLNCSKLATCRPPVHMLLQQVKLALQGVCMQPRHTRAILTYYMSPYSSCLLNIAHATSHAKMAITFPGPSIKFPIGCSCI